MCGGAIKKIFGGGSSQPTQVQVADPTPTALSDVSGDTSKAGAGKTKDNKGKGFASTVNNVATPLSSSTEETGKKKLGQ